MAEFRRGGARGRVLTVVLALLALQLGRLVAPAWACGCGAMVPGDARRVTVGREESVVRWDGEREQVVMRLTVGGDVERVAWIMPVPRRATVRLGDPELFDEPHDVTAPAHRDRYHFWTATDPDALDGRLDSNGFALPPGLATSASAPTSRSTRRACHASPRPRSPWARTVTGTLAASVATAAVFAVRRSRRSHLRRSAESTILESLPGKTGS